MTAVNIVRNISYVIGVGVMAQAMVWSSQAMAAMTDPAIPSELIKRPQYRQGALLVKYKQGADSDARINASRSMRALRQKSAVQYERLLRETADGGRGAERWRLVTFSPNINLRDAQATLAGDAEVEAVEPDYAVTNAFIPKDPAYDQQWSLENIQAPLAWDLQRGSSTVAVAVVDTGVDYNHDDLSAAMWVNKDEKPDNGLDDDGNGYVDDFYGYDFSDYDAWPNDLNGHGTHVAGSIAAVPNNDKLIAGAGGSVRVMAVRFLDETGAGWVSDAVRAIGYAVDRGANIINASWGSPSYSYLLYDAVKRAADKNVLFVAAAGNNGKDADREAFFPAAFDLPNIVSVAAIDRQNRLTYFSNFGAKTVDIAAPGDYILSTVPRSGCSDQYWGIFPVHLCDASGMRSLYGTSMASPHVAAAAALLLSRYPALRFAELKKTLIDTSARVAGLAGKTVLGSVVDANATVGATFPAPYDVILWPDKRVIASAGTQSHQVSILITPVKGFSGNFTLTALKTEPRLTATLSPSNLKLTGSSPISALLTVTPGAKLSRGHYPIQVTLTDPNRRAFSTQVMVEHQAPDFDLSLKSSDMKLTVGQSGSNIVTIKSVNNYAGKITLTALGAPAGVTPVFSPNPVTVTAGGIVESTMHIPTASTTPVRETAIYVQGSDGNSVHAPQLDLRTLANGLDLVVDDFKLPESKLNMGATYPFWVSIANQGSTPLQYSSRFGIYLSTDRVVTNSDVLLLQVTNIAPPDSGGMVAANYDVEIPFSVATGRYYISAIVDDKGEAAEVDESNNAYPSPVSVELISGVDLIVSNLTVDVASQSTGRAIQITDTLQNAGTNRTRLATGKPITIRYYLSPDRTITNADPYLGERTWSTDLPAGASFTDKTKIIIPSANMVAGSYYVGAIVDPDKKIAEKEEGNNSVAGPAFTLRHNADLSVTIAAPARQTLWGNMRVNGELTNAGTSPVVGAATSFYVSTDNVLSSDDLLLWKWETAEAVPAQGKQTIGFNYFPTMPPLAARNYYIVAMTDSASLIQETNEANNRAIQAITFVNDLDVAIEGLSLDKTKFTGADSFNFEARLKNLSSSMTRYTYFSAYISKTARYDDATATLLSDFATQDLIPGKTYLDTRQVYVPKYPAGRYYIIVKLKTEHDINRLNDEKAVPIDFVP